MNKHCKGCISHYNAGHPQNSKLRIPFNDWCCKLGGYAKKCVSHCKVHNLKQVKHEIIT